MKRWSGTSSSIVEGVVGFLMVIGVVHRLNKIVTSRRVPPTRQGFPEKVHEPMSQLPTRLELCCCLADYTGVTQEIEVHPRIHSSALDWSIRWYTSLRRNCAAWKPVDNMKEESGKVDSFLFFSLIPIAQDLHTKGCECISIVSMSLGPLSETVSLSATKLSLLFLFCVICQHVYGALNCCT